MEGNPLAAPLPKQDKISQAYWLIAYLMIKIKKWEKKNALCTWPTQARASKMKWKGKETIGFTFFELPCHNKHKKIFFLFYLSIIKEESPFDFSNEKDLATRMSITRRGSLYHSAESS